MWILYLLFFMTCGSSSVMARQTDAADLKLKLKKGETYYIANKTEIEMSMDMMGRKINMNINTKEGFEYFVEDVDRDGMVTVRVTFKDIQYKEESDLGGVSGTEAQIEEYDSKKETNPDKPRTKVFNAVIGKSFTLKLTSNGNIVELQGLTDMLSNVASELRAGGIDGLGGANDVKVSPDGVHLYVAGNSDNAIAVFDISRDTGKLKFIGVHTNGIERIVGMVGPSAILINRDGKHLYVTNTTSNTIVVFNRNNSSGALVFVEVVKNGEKGVDKLKSPTGITLSPDEKHIYVANTDSDNIMVFSRDHDTGSLTFIETLEDDVNGVDGLFGAVHVAVSQDRKHVYVTGQIDDAVAVFSRDSATGKLAFTEVHFDEENGVDGLDEAFDVKFSPDGAHLYITGGEDDALTVFSRNSITGSLTFVEMQKNGVQGVNGIDNPGEINFSPDGKFVYVSSHLSDAVAVFSRKSESGALTFVDVKKNKMDNVQGLDYVPSLAVSPDGNHLYAVGREDNAVSVFERNSNTGTLTFLEFHKDGVNLEGTQLYLSKFTEESIQENMKSIFNIYPDNLVSIGDSWTKESTVNLEEFQMESNTTYTLQSRSNGLSTVGVKGTLEMNPGSAIPGLGDLPSNVSMNFNLEGTQEGNLVVSETTGLIQESDITLNISGNIEMTNSTNPALTINIQITMTGKTGYTSEKR